MREVRPEWLIRGPESLWPGNGRHPVLETYSDEACSQSPPVASFLSISSSRERSDGNPETGSEVSLPVANPSKSFPSQCSSLLEDKQSTGPWFSDVILSFWRVESWPDDPFCFPFSHSTLEGYYVDDALQGQGVYTYEDGGVLQGTYVDGELNGLAQEYDTDGRLIFKGQYKDNIRHGLCWIYFPVSDCSFCFKTEL